MSTAREQAREAVMHAFLPSIPKQIEANIAANAASDVWEALVQQIHQLSNVSFPCTQQALMVAIIRIEELAAEALGDEYDE